VSQLTRACISKEFSVLAANKASPITDWLRALARDLHQDIGGKGVGAIGMCLTGNFALALAMDDCMIAPVLSQPSLPFPFSKTKNAALHISDDQLGCLKRRSKEEGLTVLGLRFVDDAMSPGTRFETLRRELGDQFEGIEIPSKYGNPNGNKMAHSVVTTDLIDKEGEPTRKALERVLSFFHQRLD
jgi:dienelactone hydrolase